jgi:L-rhamnonate dehydratase
MKITSVEAIPLKLPVITKAVDGTQDNLLIRISTDEGLTGYGEVDSSPVVAKAAVDAEMSHGICYGLGEILVGQNPLHTEQLWKEMFRKTIYHGRAGAVVHAMSGIDMALWDIAGKVRNEPIHQMLGACYRTRVMAYASALMPETPEEARDLAAGFRAQGFHAMKFGWGPIGRSAALDRALFHAVREGAGSQARVMIDAGQAYTAKQAIDRARTLEEIGATWFEEPLHPDDIEGFALLAEHTSVPVAAGEAECVYPAFARLINEGRIDVVQPDLSRAGGFTEGRKIAQLAEHRKRRIIPHAFKSNILLAASLHMCAAFESAEMLEYSMTESPIRRQLTHQALPAVDGYVDVPTAPGLGVDVDQDAVKRLAAAAS